MTREVTYKVRDLFRTVFVYENGLEGFALPELGDIKNLCRTVIEMADEKEQEIKKTYTGKSREEA